MRQFFKKVAAALLATFALLGDAQAQSVQQSGNVTPNHLTTWAAPGVIKDGGGAVVNVPLAGGSLFPIATGATAYCSSSGCDSNAGIAATSSITGAIGNLYFQTLNPPVGGQTFTATLFTGTYGSLVATSVTCQITGSNTSCSDINHTATIAAGQTWVVQVVSSGSAAATLGQSFSLQMTAQYPPPLPSQTVLQSGTITGGHAVTWVAPGIIRDAGFSIVAPNTPIFPPNSVFGNPTSASAAPTATSTPTVTTPPVGDDSNRVATTAFVQNSLSSPITVKTTSYTIASTDCNSTIEMGTGSTGFLNLTLPLPANLPSGCRVTIVNGDNARGKKLINFPAETYPILYPNQAISVRSTGSDWIVTDAPGRWRPTSLVSMFVNVQTGDNNNDGLDSSTPLATSQAAWNVIAANLDLAGISELATSFGAVTVFGFGLDTNGLNMTDSPPGGCFTGSSNSPCIIFTSATGIAADYVIRKDSAGFAAITQGTESGGTSEVAFLTMSVGNTLGDCVVAALGAIRVHDISILGCGGAALYAKHLGHIFVSGPVNVLGGGNYLFAAQSGGLLIPEFQTITFANPVTYAVALVLADEGAIYASGMTFVNPGNVTGPKYSADHFGVINIGGGNPNSYFPGTVAGTSSFDITKHTFSGTTSGAITVQPQAAAGTYNWNWPTTAGTTNQPLISKGGGATAMDWGSLSGNTSTFATTSGSLPAGNCIQADANGNLVDAGGACGGGGGSGTVSAGVGGQLTYYAVNGTTVVGNANHTVASGAVTHGIAGSVLGQVKVTGNTSGTITVQPQAAAGTYNFNLPTSAGTSGQPLLSGGGGATAQSYGTLGVGAGGTGLTSGTSGGVLAFTGAGTLASSGALTANRLVLGGGAGAAPIVAGSLGTTTTVLHGNAAGAPSFGAVALAADVSGTLPVANGGTGITAGTSGGVLAFTGAGTIASSGALTANRLVLGGGAGAAPTVLGSLGTTSTVLHGNAAGAPSFGAVALATDVSGTLPVANGGTGATTLSSGLAVVGNGTSPVTSGTGINSNILNTQTSNYTIATTDCGKTVQAGTGSSGQFTVTLPAVAGFATNCSVLITNGDSVRGKIMAGFPAPIRNRLYPGQTVGVKIINGAWKMTQTPDRWVLSGATSLFLDPAGSDNNDCLATGAANACQTMQGVWDLMAKGFDLNGFVVTVNMAAGVYTSGLAANTMPPGTCANSCIVFNGAAMTTVFIRVNTTTAVGVGGSGSIARQPSMTLSNVTINNAGGTCIQGDGGSIYISNIRFGDGTGAKACGGPALYARHQGAINLTGDLTFTGGAANSIDYMGFSQTAGTLYVENHTVNISANVTCNVSCWVAAAGQIWSGDLAFNLGAFTVTGQRYSANQHGIIISEGNVDPGGPTHFAGTIPGQQVLLGVYDKPGTPAASACGAAPAPSVQTDSTDVRGMVTVGGGGVTSCTITLTNFYNNRPLCIVTSEASGATALTGFGYTITPGVGVVTRTITMSWTAGTPTNLQWQCLY